MRALGSLFPHFKSRIRGDVPSSHVEKGTMGIINCSNVHNSPGQHFAIILFHFLRRYSSKDADDGGLFK